MTEEKERHSPFFITEQPVTTLWVLPDSILSISFAFSLSPGFPKTQLSIITDVSAPIIISCGYFFAISSALRLAKYSGCSSGGIPSGTVSSTPDGIILNSSVIRHNSSFLLGDAEAKITVSILNLRRKCGNSAV